MQLIWRYLKPFLGTVAAGMLIKFLGTACELSIPYILEHIIDVAVPAGVVSSVFLWGLLMIFMSVLCRQLNVTANRLAARVSSRCIFQIRGDFFRKTIGLSGSRFDAFGLPSLTSRLTSDSYNVQNFITRIQTLGIRVPIMLIGGFIITMAMDLPLAMILFVMTPVLLGVVLLISIRGVPLFDQVQVRLDSLIRIMRENITGIRVVKALSREDYARSRYGDANHNLTRQDIRANAVMAIPGPFMQLCLNIGLTLVIIIGARRVNAGLMKPGVILAFLTYFNMILQSIMGLNRLFVMYSKAKASADRIDQVLQDLPDQQVLPEEAPAAPRDDSLLRFDHVSFSYGAGSGDADGSPAGNFAGGNREYVLDDISFDLRRGESLGIIGATGSGKSTIVSLLMRFYDCSEGHVYLEGRDIRTCDFDGLRRRFGVVLQNDTIFASTISDNISFGRDLTEAEIGTAAEDACADFIADYADGPAHRADIRGANFSGGQKQRILIARALAARPEILILDDSSSALDYRTDARLRRTLREKYSGTTTVMIAQRVSSIMNCTKILVLENGRTLALGDHETLLQTCPLYREIYMSQMGEIA